MSVQTGLIVALFVLWLIAWFFGDNRRYYKIFLKERTIFTFINKKTSSTTFQDFFINDYYQYILLDFYIFCAMKKQFALFTQVFNFEVFKLIFEQLNLHGANQMVKSHYVSLSAFLFEDSLLYLASCLKNKNFKEPQDRDHVAFMLCEFFRQGCPQGFFDQKD